MIVPITVWIVIVLDVLVTLNAVSNIGKPTEKITEQTAVWGVILLAVMSTLLFLTWTQVHTLTSRIVLEVSAGWLLGQVLRLIMRVGVTPDPRTPRYVVRLLLANAAEVVGMLWVWTRR